MKSSKDIDLIHLADSGFSFGIDSFCITLYRRRITKKGTLQWDAIGYYTSLEAMFKRLVDLVGLDGCKDLQHITDRHIELKNWLSSTLEKLTQNPSMNDQALKNRIRIPS